MAKQIPSAAAEDAAVLPECFVIMPVADPDGYEAGHFLKVYQDIFGPACREAGFKAVRADEVRETNLIHLDILQKLIDSPMAICDLSARNPNVLFELGLRQAFDKPTVLVQEVGTPKIFDIAPLRYTEYRKELRYRDVLEDQAAVAAAIAATRDATKKGRGVNSIVKILSLSHPAALQKVNEADAAEGLLQLVRAELSDMRSEFRRATNVLRHRDAQAFSATPKNNLVRVPLGEMLEAARTDLTRASELLNRGAAPEAILRRTNRVQRLVTQVGAMSDSLARHEAEKLFREAEAIEGAVASGAMARRPQYGTNIDGTDS